MKRKRDNAMKRYEEKLKRSSVDISSVCVSVTFCDDMKQKPWSGINRIDDSVGLPTSRNNKRNVFKNMKLNKIWFVHDKRKYNPSVHLHLYSWRLR